VAVIGVHSAKFFSEKDPENIRDAMRRHDVRHPVVVDSDHEVWQRFGVKAWPTIVLVDARGRIRDTLPGEADEEELAARIEELLDDGSRAGVLAPGPLDIAPDPAADATFLRYPGKVHVGPSGLFVADTGHNRIVWCDSDGRVKGIVGEGGAGGADGPAAGASFHHPQGVAVIGRTLYVADTGNHLLRAVDLDVLEVRTVAGTGEKGRGLGRFDPLRPRELALRSPWALQAVGEQLLVTMAGTHQIWVFDPARNALGPWAGSGREDHIDGPLAEAAFAQPSGLARSGKFLFVADSEISSIRVVDLQTGTVQTIVGRGLFDFGDQDGSPDRVLMQHPMDVAVDGRKLYVADTYNNKIKSIVFGTMETATVFGDGSRAVLHEPGGLAASAGRLYVADTNNHRVLVGDLATGALEPLPIGG
jgi:DNA-binding beta-propeller fold protein YncE